MRINTTWKPFGMGIVVKIRAFCSSGIRREACVFLVKIMGNHDYNASTVYCNTQ